MLKVMLSAICVLAAALTSAQAADAPPAAGITVAGITPASIAGRWQGDTWASDNSGPLTLDIVACGGGWCGIKVGASDACGATALKLDGGAPEDENVNFAGKLELAPGTEPYVVRASIFAPNAETPSAPLTMQITGDTGGEYRAYRRSFPFEAQMARKQDSVCHAPQTVSSLQ